MSIVIDIILVAVIIGLVIYSAKKGVIVTVLEVVAFIVAIFLASQAAAPVASGMYTAFFQKTVENKLYDIVPENPTSLTYAQKAQYVVDGLPDFAKSYAKGVGIDVPAISEQLAKLNLANNDKLYESLESELVRPIAVAVLKNIMFFVMAILFAIILRAIVKAICKNLKKLSAIGALDGILGGLFGVVKGVVVVFLLCCILSYMQPKLENETMKSAISDSAIVTAASSFDPMETITAYGVFNN